MGQRASGGAASCDGAGTGAAAAGAGGGANCLELARAVDRAALRRAAGRLDEGLMKA